MSFPEKNRNKSVSNKYSNKYLGKVKDKNKELKPLIHNTYSPKNNNNNFKLSITHNTVSTKFSNPNTYPSFNRTKYSSSNSYQIKPICEENNNLKIDFIQKKKKIFKSQTIINQSKISFQRQKDKNILEFSLFDDKLIFKDINRSYLQDEHSDDGDDSSEEAINNGKILLSEELEQSIEEMKRNLKNKQNKQILSRKMRFKSDNNKE